MPVTPSSQENNKTQFHINTDKIVHDRLQQANYQFSKRAAHHIAWVLKTGRDTLNASGTSIDKTKQQNAEQHVHELMDSIVAHAKNRSETGTITFGTVDIACREKVSRNWPL